VSTSFYILIFFWGFWDTERKELTSAQLKKKIMAINLKDKMNKIRSFKWGREKVEMEEWKDFQWIFNGFSMDFQWIEHEGEQWHQGHVIYDQWMNK